MVVKSNHSFNCLPTRATTLNLTSTFKESETVLTLKSISSQPGQIVLDQIFGLVSITYHLLPFFVMLVLQKDHTHFQF